MSLRANQPFSNANFFFRNCILISFERNHDPCFVRDKMVDNPWVPIAAVVLYAGGIVLGKAYFANRPAWNWRKSMAMWNFGLSIFSAIGFLRTFPQLVHNMIHYTITENLCHDPESQYGSGATGFLGTSLLFEQISVSDKIMFLWRHPKNSPLQ